MPVEFTGTTGSKSTFQIEPPKVLRLRLMINAELLKNEPCKVSFDGGAPVEKSADGEGLLEVPIPKGAKKARVVLLKHKPVEHVLRLIQMSPKSTVSGQKLRLRQLGYYSGKLTHFADADSDLKTALIHFQRKHKLKQSGSPDSDTQDALAKTYGY